MSYTVETAPPARCRSAEARRAARQAKASREKRIVECLNRGVPIVEIAEREDVSENRMRRLVRDVLARRMPAPPAQFIVMQVNRLNEALRLSFGAMSGANLQAVDRVVKIVRELDRYHGFTAAERWGLPIAPIALEQADLEVMAGLVKRIREMTLEDIRKIESAPKNGMVPEDQGTRDPAPERDGALESAPDTAGAPLASAEMAPQRFEKIDSRVGNGMASEAASPLDMAPAHCEPLVSPTAANPGGPRRLNLRMTLNGVVAG
jgi:hypothetical protein